MKTPTIRKALFFIITTWLTSTCATAQSKVDDSIGRHEVYTLPFDDSLDMRSATFTPSGRVLVSYAKNRSVSRRNITLATVEDNGSKMRTFFSGTIPVRPKDNGIRFMIFPDNKRIFLGDFVIECSTSLESCKNPSLLPVVYPPEVASGDHVSHRWSEMIISPDNSHVAWTTLLSNYSALVFTGELRKEDAAYVIADARIISTLDPFEQDPDHPDGVKPQTIRGGEVKQFVNGGGAISLVGAIRRDLPDSVVQHLATGEMEAITDTAGYTETTIFSPDERLGIVMTTRFSESTDPAILGLMPRPYPASLNMGLSMLAYTYAVTGVRQIRPGNIGPALIDIEASKARVSYRGINLNEDPNWVYGSPMSWHPGGRKAMWEEATRGARGDRKRRARIVRLLDYQPSTSMPAAQTPEAVPYGTADLSVVEDYAKTSNDIDVKVYGRHSGHLTYKRSPAGIIEKTYSDFSEDGEHVYSGTERMEGNPSGRSTYSAKIRLSGPTPGTMDLKMTFGPLGGEYPARLIFDKDPSGTPLTHGYVIYGGQRLDAANLVP